MITEFALKPLQIVSDTIQLIDQKLEVSLTKFTFAVKVDLRPGKKKKLFSVHPSQFFQVGRAVFFCFFFVFFLFFFVFAMRFILSLIYSGAPVCTYNSVIMKQRFHCSL